jgi:hypothetical protein
VQRVQRWNAAGHVCLSMPCRVGLFCLAVSSAAWS